MIVGVLTTHREVAFQNRIGEDEFRGPEIIRAVGVALDVALCLLLCSNRLNGRCLLCGTTWSLCLIEESVNIQVDTQLAQLAVVIGVEDVLAEVVVLPDMALRVLLEVTVLIGVGEEIAGQLTTGMTIVLVVGTKTVLFVDHIVYLQLGRPSLPDILCVLGRLAYNIV